MEKWYIARFGEIQEVVIERCTGKFVVLPSGRREAIDSYWMWYRKDREQAKMAMISQYEKERDAAKMLLYQREKKLADAHSA